MPAILCNIRVYQLRFVSGLDNVLDRVKLAAAGLQASQPKKPVGQNLFVVETDGNGLNKRDLFVSPCFLKHLR